MSGRPRLIPVLLMRRGALVKSIRFKRHRYIGDPLNAARIFNDLGVDELICLDIAASAEKRSIPIEFVNRLAEEMTMPFSVGGGITTLEQINHLTRAGVEKVIIGSHAVRDPRFVAMAADEFGSSTISVCIDVKNDWLRGPRVRHSNGRIRSEFKPVQFSRLMQECGAGEIIIQSIDNDGAMTGYDIDLLRSIMAAVDLPVVALGGAGNQSHLVSARRDGNANGLAAGSMFVYHSSARGVLINYPEDKRFLYDMQ